MDSIVLSIELCQLSVQIVEQQMEQGVKCINLIFDI